MRTPPRLVALAVGLGCAATAPPPEPRAPVYLACGYDVRPASGPYGLMFGNSARLGWVCREVVLPPIPELPELSREGVADGPGILVEAP